MTVEIKDYVAKRTVCATSQKEQPNKPLISHKIPSRHWETAGCHIFHFEDRDYLCTVDYYSKYFEIDHLKLKTASEVVHTLKRHFFRHGIRHKRMSDNGPPFNSFEFQQFVARYDTAHITSSPHYQQSNGKVENAIKTAKNLLDK
ncbi:uncharacterized protein [Montipora foliosa]|uniref:uncharacterized protein n=1 Tax=Montipora foliosa TaxID=591990 RepID=UPI0035F1A430